MTHSQCPHTKRSWATSLLGGSMRNDLVNENELQYLYRVFFCVRTSCPVLMPTRKHRIGPTRPQLDQFCSASRHQPPFRLSILRRYLAFAPPPRQIKANDCRRKPPRDETIRTSSHRFSEVVALPSPGAHLAAAVAAAVMGRPLLRRPSSWTARQDAAGAAGGCCRWGRRPPRSL